MTRYVYGRKLDPIARASGAGLAAGFRCESLSRLASRHRSRERPERSEEAYLYLLAPRLGGSHHFGRGFHRSPQTTVRIRLARRHRSEEHTSELQSLMRISYAVFCLKKKN